MTHTPRRAIALASMCARSALAHLGGGQYNHTRICTFRIAPVAAGWAGDGRRRDLLLHFFVARSWWNLWWLHRFSYENRGRLSTLKRGVRHVAYLSITLFARGLP